MAREPLRAGAGTNAQSLASAIAHAFYENTKEPVPVRAIGAGAVNQTAKAIAIARGYVAPRGLDLICVPSFASVKSRDGEISAVIFTVEVR